MMLLSLPRIFPSCLALVLLLSSLDGMACSGRLHIEVQASGVYALDYAAIAAQQPGLKDCASDDLVLLNRGREVPIRVLGDGSGRFGPGGHIEWVGLALHGPQSWYDQYSPVNVYQLAAQPGAHARLRQIPAPAATKPMALRRKLHFEQENLMLRMNDREMKPGEEPDVWQWAKLTPIDPKAFDFTFDLPDVDQRDVDLRMDAPTTLTLDFRGVSNVIAAAGTTKAPDHVIELSLNGKPLPSLSWDGRDEMRKEITIARALLKEKGNSIAIRVPKRPLATDPAGFIVDVVMFNWLEAAYPIRGNLAASKAPFAVADDGAVALDAAGENDPELYGVDGSYQKLIRVDTGAEAGRYRADAGRGVDYYPVTGNKKLKPTLVRAIAAEDLRAADPGYDYLIVAHPRLREAIEPLAQFHRGQGLKVAVYNVDDVYDQFHGGIIHPAAIRDLVAWGTQHWTVKPRYLLLVGDASFDIHHDLRSNRPNARQYALRPDLIHEELVLPGDMSFMNTTSYSQWDEQLPNRNLIPTWQFPTPEGQSASDNDFVTMKVGEFHPTLAVGRFPVVEPAEVKVIVDKTIAYLSNPVPGSWRRDVTFVSTSEVASFKQESDKIAADLVRQGYVVNNLYTDFNDKDTQHYRAARDTLKQDLDAGNLLVHFIGHGGGYVWRVGPLGDLFSLDDVSKLTNAGRYPMVLAMTCFSAPFDNPSDDSIGERFLREADKGAVAVFAASWTNWPNPTYSKTLIGQLLKPGVRIGDAIVAAKATIGDRAFVEMYNLLGDPAVVLARPQGTLQMMREKQRWDPQVLVRVPQPDFGGEVYVDWIDADGRILVSRHYQARDIQFMLAPVDKAVTVNVYVADGRNDYTAFGSLSLVEPPKPPAPVAVATSAPATPPKPLPAAKVAPTAPAPRPRTPPNPRDSISRQNFDTPVPPTPTPARSAAHPAGGSH